MSTSSTGPQIATWQYFGVDTMNATGPPCWSAASRLTVWNGHAGSRVQMGFTPRWSAAVGVWSTGMASPARGTGTLSGVCTAKLASTGWPPISVLAVYVPAAGGVKTTG